MALYTAPDVSLSAGMRVGSYEILSPSAAVAWVRCIEARDSKLKREVANIGAAVR